MTAEVRVEVLLKSLTEMLECPQKTIARLIHLHEHTFSNNKGKSLASASESTRWKMTQLYNVVREYACQGLKPEVIFTILQDHVYPDRRDRLDSVSSAISQEKYDEGILLEIAANAHKRYQVNEKIKIEALEPMSSCAQCHGK